MDSVAVDAQISELTWVRVNTTADAEMLRSDFYPQSLSDVYQL